MKSSPPLALVGGAVTGEINTSRHTSTHLRDSFVLPFSYQLDRFTPSEILQSPLFERASYPVSDSSRVGVVIK